MSDKETTPLLRLGVGIDTARYGHHATFLREDFQPAARPMTIMENRESYQQLQESLHRLHKKHPQAHFHVHIDAAGQYAVNLERFVRTLDLPMTVSVGEPKRNKDYQRVHFPKRKADATESYAMARFGVVERPDATFDVPESFCVLREVAGRLQAQSKDAVRAVNRLHNLVARVFPELEFVAKDISAAWVLKLLKAYPTAEKIARARLASLSGIPYLTESIAQTVQAAARHSVGTLRGEIAEAMMAELVDQMSHAEKSKKRLQKLLIAAYRALPDGPHRQIESIPGIGEVTAAVLVAKIISIDRFPSPGCLVGHFGVFPEANDSGVDRYGHPKSRGTMKMCRKGNDLVRAYLWNAARVAIQYNPAVRALYRRLRAKGTRGDIALGHCMSKLLHLVFAIWKSDRPFDPNHYPWEQADRETPSTDANKEKAAGHNEEILPERKVVTAADSSIDPPEVPVNLPASPVATTGQYGSVDYEYLREQISIAQVLRHFGHYDRLRGGVQLRGPCPIHGSSRPQSRSFAVHLEKNVFHCFHPPCAAQGNTLDLWATVRKLPIYEAALDLAETFHLQLNRNREDGTRNDKPPTDENIKCKKTGDITPDPT
jgi:transposase